MSKSNPESTRKFNRCFTVRLMCRSMLALFLLTGVVACASVEAQPEPPLVVAKVVTDDGLASADSVYSSGDYEAALEEFKAISLNRNAIADSRRTAHLGEALIYLSSDQKWHSLENAKMALRSAGQVVAAENEKFSPATDMMMDAITISIGTESRYAELHSQSGNFRTELARVKSERDALLADNDKLRREQIALNEAMERLKNLTLGN